MTGSERRRQRRVARTERKRRHLYLKEHGRYAIFYYDFNMHLLAGRDDLQEAIDLVRRDHNEFYWITYFVIDRNTEDRVFTLQRETRQSSQSLSVLISNSKKHLDRKFNWKKVGF